MKGAAAKNTKGEGKRISIEQSLRTGIGFGTASGVTTTIGLIIGLAAGTHSTAVVLGGVITIAVADALSDALGIHLSEESSSETTNEEIWKSTLATFITKFTVALTFAVPILLLSLNTAVIACILWGMLLLAAFSAYVANIKNETVWQVVLEHWAIAIVVVITTFIIGTYIVRPIVGG